LSFCKIIILCDDIAEVIIDDGVEMDLHMVEQYHCFLLSHLANPFSVVINRVNSYTYSFDAQMAIGTLDEINVIAIISYHRVTDISTNMVASLPREKEWKYRIFHNRDEAMNWAKSEQLRLKGCPG